MPRSLAGLRFLSALVLVASPLVAQEKAAKRAVSADSTSQALLMDFSLSMLRPADFVLNHRAELAISDAQVRRLESLSKALAESTTVRETRMIKAQAPAEQAQVRMIETLAQGWTGPIDEAGLRRLACESATAGLAPLLGLARDRRMVGAVLTDDQIVRLAQLEHSNRLGILHDIDEPVRDAPAEATDHPYFEFQVEQPASLVPGTPDPAFPAELRGVLGRGGVLAQFVVDTTGRVEMNSFKAIKSSREVFTEAVRHALPTMRFVPASIGGRPVRQLVQMPFEFTAPPER